jgi:hypothetical protein
MSKQQGGVFGVSTKQDSIRKERFEGDSLTQFLLVWPHLRTMGSKMTP